MPSIIDNVIQLPVAQLPAEKVGSGWPYPNEQEAESDLMRVAIGVLRDIRAAGGKPPPVSRLVKDFDRLWKVYRLFADPKGKHGKGTQRPGS